MTKLKYMLEFFIKPINLWYDVYENRVIRMFEKKKKFKAIDFANWFLWYNELQKIQQSSDFDNDDNYDVYEGLTHLKIQKLLYFADGIALAVTDKPLFSEKIYAWPHGPVIKEVYDVLKANGRDEIAFDKDNLKTINEINNDSELSNILETTYDNYAGYTAWQLREKSHVAGGPWQVTVDTKGMQREISANIIEEYFKKNIVNVNEK